MNDLSHHFKKSTAAIRLSREEKARMRQTLLHVMRPKRIPSPYFSFSPLFMRTTAALLVLVIISGGTAFASGGALPGDVLYPVKVRVLEPVQGVAALTPVAQASWNTKLAARRAEEAETLAARGTLSAQTESDLEASIAKNTEAADDAVEKLAASDASGAARLSAELDSSLGAHGEILAALGTTSTDDRTRGAADTLSRFLHHRSRGSVVAEEDSNQDASTTLAAASLSGTSTPLLGKRGGKKPVEQIDAKGLSDLKNAGTDSLKEARGRFKSFGWSFATSTSSDFEKRFSQIESEINNATDTSSATGALKNATKLRTFLEASGRLNRNDLLESTLQNDHSNDSRGKGGSDSNDD